MLICDFEMKILNNTVFVCMCVHSMLALPQKPEESAGCPENAAMGGCEPPVGAENQTWVPARAASTPNGWAAPPL